MRIVQSKAYKRSERKETMMDNEYSEMICFNQINKAFNSSSYIDIDYKSLSFLKKMLQFIFIQI